MPFKLVVARGERAGTEVSLEGQEAFVVGSSPDAHVSLPDKGVLEFHVRLIPEGKRLILADVSGQGVPLNGKKATTAELRIGDEILLGTVVLRIDDGGSPDPTPRTATGRRVRSQSGKLQSPVFSKKSGSSDSRPALFKEAADSRPQLLSSGKPTPPPRPTATPLPGSVPVPPIPGKGTPLPGSVPVPAIPGKATPPPRAATPLPGTLPVPALPLPPLPPLPPIGRALPPMPSSPLPPPAVLWIVKGTDKGKEISVDQALTLGRGSTCNAPLLDKGCSREHCRVERRADGFFVVDLGSTNGTKINDVRMESSSTVKLRSGDRLKIGTTTIEFRNAGETPTYRPDEDSKRLLDEGSDESVPGVRQDASTARFRVSGVLKSLSPGTGGAALSGDLEKMGFADVVQFLHLSRKSGELLVKVVGGEGAISFHEGNVRDAWGAGGKTGEDNFYAMAILKKGQFEFHENTPAREPKIKLGTLALLMEAMRLRDEKAEA